MQDKAFANASLGTRPWVSALIFILGAAAALGLLTGVCTSIFFSKGIRLLVKAEGKNKGNKYTKRIAKVTSVVSGAYLLFILLRMSSFIYVDIQLNSSFDQRMMAIRPYIEDRDSHRLRSEWALMQKRQDYERINAKLDEYARKADIVLPTLLYR